MHLISTSKYSAFPEFLGDHFTQITPALQWPQGEGQVANDILWISKLQIKHLNGNCLLNFPIVYLGVFQLRTNKVIFGALLF